MKQFPGFQRGVNLGGWMSHEHYEPEHLASFIHEEDIERIASWGLDHVRLPVDYNLFEQQGAGEPLGFRYVDLAVTWCRRHGLNLILDLHKTAGFSYEETFGESGFFDSESYQQRFFALWETFARRYGGDPEHIAFELLNEVRGNAADAWNQLAARTLAALRALNPTRTVIIGTANWNSCGDLARLQLHDDPNVIYTWHFYSPFEFTHQQGVLQAAPLFYNRKMPYPGDAERYRDFARTVHHQDNAYSGLKTIDINWMRQATQPAWDFQAQHPDKQVWCGEFGTIRHIRTEYRENWMHDLISLLLEHHTPYCVWNYLSTPNDGNRFSLVDDDHRTIVSPRMARIIRGQLD